MTKQCHDPQTHQAAAYSEPDDGDAEVDIRPRFFDPLTKQWVLLDTGAQVSCVAPSPDDVPDPHLALETVDGSLMPCYGKKKLSFQIGRKTFHQTVYITNTSETILGITP